MSPTWITTDEGFWELEPAWSKLFSQNGEHSVFLSWEWMSTWWRHFGAGRELRVLCMTDAAGVPCLIAPFQVISRRVAGVPVSEDWLLLGAESPACSDHLGFLRDPSVGAAEINEAMEEVWSHLGLRARIRLTDLGPDELWVGRVAAWARRTGLEVRSRPGEVRPLLKLPTRWDDFIPGLSRKLRTQVRRSLRKVEAHPRVQRQQVTEPDEVRAAARDVVRLNRTRMDMKGIVSSLGDPRMARFLEDVTVNLVVAGRAWLDVMRTPEGVVATALHLVHGDTVSSYQGGFDPAYKSLWPPTCLSTRAIERAVNQGYRWFDFLRGDEPYKYRWGAVWVRGVEVAVIPPGLKARIIHGLPAAWSRLRSLARLRLSRRKADGEAGA